MFFLPILLIILGEMNKDDQRWQRNLQSKRMTSFNFKASSQVIYSFPDLLLHQALVGSSPNTMVLSYLKHAMATQVWMMCIFKSLVERVDLMLMYMLLDVQKDTSRENMIDGNIC